MRRAQELGRLVVALAGVLVAAGGMVAVLAPGPDARVTTASATNEAVAWVVLVAAVALIVAGVAAWIPARPGSGLALIAFWAAAAWLAPELAGSASVTPGARSLGLLLTPMAVPLLVHLPARALRANRRAVRATLLALYAVAAVLALGHSLTWDAFRVYDCSPVCRQGDNILGWFVDIPVSLQFRSAGWWLASIAGTAMAVASVVRLRRPRTDGTAEAPVLVASMLVGIAMVGSAMARLSVPRPSAIDPWPVRTAVLLAAAVIALGITVAWLRWRQGQRAAGVRRLVELVDAGAGSRSLGETLASVLRDPTVRVAYPLGGARGHVDDMGRATTPPGMSDGRAVTPIERAGVVVALVEHDVGLDPELLSREVGAAARLAVDNERLSATLRAQVRELQASRERIVATGDAARGRLERNLHDGAQQRLLAVSYELRLAQAAATDEAPERRAALDGAVGEIDRALAELRDLAHGIWPATLAEAGLEMALESLAGDAPIPVTLTGIPEGRLPALTEAAAYLVVTEALRRAVSGGAPGLSIRAERTADRFLVDARIPGRSIPGPWLRVDDRVGAAGGQSAVSTDPALGTLLSVELPCA